MVVVILLVIMKTSFPCRSSLIPFTPEEKFHVGRACVGYDHSRECWASRNDRAWWLTTTLTKTSDAEGC